MSEHPDSRPLAGLTPSLLELLDRATLRAIRAWKSMGLDGDPAEAAQLLEIRRLAYPAAGRLGQCLVEDVGALKRRWLALELGDTALDVHRSIKQALDPLGIMNPGKAF